MKIAFLVNQFPVLSETFILNQITGLLDRGHDVEIFAMSNPGETKAHQAVEGYHLMERTHYLSTDMNGGSAKRLANASKLLKYHLNREAVILLRSLNIIRYRRMALSLKLYFIVARFLGKNFDVIHCHFGQNGIIGTYLCEVGIKARVLTTFHGYDVNSYVQGVGPDVYRGLFSKGDFFTANTNFTKGTIERLGCPSNKIEILPMGISLAKLRYKERKLLPGERVKLLTVGRLVEKKGHEFVIRAISLIAEKSRNVLYLIAGDGPLRSKLESLVSELGISSNVNFYGHANQDELLKLYDQAHIFTLPCVTASNGDKEGQALVIQEAQAVGLPVISTFHNGIPEGIVDGQSGFLVRERDVESLADRLEYLMAHPEIWPRMGMAGRKFVEGKYGNDKVTRQLIDIYQKLVDGSIDLNR